MSVHDDVEILQVIAAPPGTRVVSLLPPGGPDDLDEEAAMAFAVITSPYEDGPERIVVAMAPDSGGTLTVRLPERNAHLLDRAIVPPGCKAVVRRLGDESFLAVCPPASDEVVFVSPKERTVQ